MKTLLLAVSLIFMTGVVSSAFAEETIKLRCDIIVKKSQISTRGEAERPSSERLNVDVEVVLIGKYINIQVSVGEGVGVSNKYQNSNFKVLADNSDNNKWDIEIQYKPAPSQEFETLSVTRISIDRNSGGINFNNQRSISSYKIEMMLLTTTTGTGQCSKVDTAKRKF
jgi:hypothetical protein